MDEARPEEPLTPPETARSTTRFGRDAWVLHWIGLAGLVATGIIYGFNGNDRTDSGTFGVVLLAMGLVLYFWSFLHWVNAWEHLAEDESAVYLTWLFVFEIVLLLFFCRSAGLTLTTLTIYSVIVYAKRYELSKLGWIDTAYLLQFVFIAMLVLHYCIPKK